MVFAETVADDREQQRLNEAAETPGQQPRENQRSRACRKGAAQGAESESGHCQKKTGAPIEAIEPPSSNKSRAGSSEIVGRNKRRKLFLTHGKVAHQVGAEWHD